LHLIVYKTIYAVIYCGLLFSKSTLLGYFPNPSLAGRGLFLVILFSGFFVPDYLYLLCRLSIIIATKNQQSTARLEDRKQLWWQTICPEDEGSYLTPSLGIIQTHIILAAHFWGF